MSSCGSNAGMETSAPLVNAIVNNALLHCNSRITQLRCRLKSFTSCCFLGRLAAPDFVMKVLRSGLFGGQKSGSSYGLLHYCSFGLQAANDH